jgi:hypothetical protein
MPTWRKTLGSLYVRVRIGIPASSHLVANVRVCLFSDPWRRDALG